jgi:folate-binding protein YgfZ
MCALQVSETTLQRTVDVQNSVDHALDQALTNAAIIDQSTMGRVAVGGADRLDVLHRLSTNDILRLRPGQLAPTVFTSDKGRIIDYAYVVVSDADILLLTLTGGEEHLVSWIEKYHIMEDITFSVTTNDTRMYTIVGPRAQEIVAGFLAVDLPQNCHIVATFKDLQFHVLHIHDLGTEFVHIIVPVEESGRMWDTLMERATSLGIPLLGASTYGIWKCMMGIPSSGELSDMYNPYEAGLRPAISLTKGCYIGQEVLARLDTYQKVQRQLVGLDFGTTDDVCCGTPIFSPDGEDVGHLTSVSGGSYRGRYPALGIVRKTAILAGTSLAVRAGSSMQRGVVTAVFDRHT